LNSKNNTQILLIIPARGGSKGIPRKNLRPLNGYPLLYYSIRTALQSTYNTDVYVSSEDDEILMFARRFGAKTIKRSEHLSGDSIPLDPVIEDAYRRLSEKKKYDLVITVQPTSPLLKSPTLDSAIQQMVSAIDTDVLISATEDRHLAWKLVEGLPMPDYEARLNRQELPAKYKESGSFVICRAENLEKAQKRITGKVDIFVLPDEEAIDIDGHLDWALAEHVLQRKKSGFCSNRFPRNGFWPRLQSPRTGQFINEA
jgi:CMP-N-acetylneuraminic acid synthetase